MHCLEQYVTMCHWAVRLKTTAAGKPSPWISPLKTPAHTHVNIHIHAFHIVYHNANSTHVCMMPHLQPPVTEHHRGAAPPWRSAAVSLDSAATANIKPGFTQWLSQMKKLWGPLPESCINNNVIGHRSAASLCNPRSTIIYSALCTPAIVIPGLVPDVISWLTWDSFPYYQIWELGTCMQGLYIGYGQDNDDERGRFPSQQRRSLAKRRSVHRLGL